ncbi:MAG TPA: aromatic amino acid lyase, partial [Steroidobacteraceae bacterium]|nr:aromatic amino acid lyase [Steroidobacteraceae bacterium]
MSKPSPVTLDGRSLSIADVVAVARHNAPVALDAKALGSVQQSRKAVEAAVARGETIYGVNTGFGKLAHVRIPPQQ